MNTAANAQNHASNGSVAGARTQGMVRIVGTGLLGTSIGLALRQLGVDVTLANHSPTSLALAVDYGAGRPAADGDTPALIVVAVPPDITAETVARELAGFSDAVVTDVASVKGELRQDLLARGVDMNRYVGSHPMAGRERGGAISARADLFIGRPWVICVDDAQSGAETNTQAAALVEALALDLGAACVQMSTTEHDESVALVSHLPQVLSTLLAAQLTGHDSALRLAGQGLRDTSRIAASDPELWVQILGANQKPVLDLLTALRADLDSMIAALGHPDVAGSRSAIAATFAAGNRGVESIPGKHGSSARFVTLTVAIDDKPGELARLFTELGNLAINIEDMRLEHSPGAQIGFVELAVLPEVAERATADLTEFGWRLV